MTTHARVLLSLAAAAVVAACARDDSYVPPIAVQPGAVARAMQLTQHLGVRASKDGPGAIAITLVDERGRAVPIARGVEVSVASTSAPSGDGGAPDATTIRASDDGEALGAELAPGEYVVRFVGGGARRAASEHSVRTVVRQGETARVSLVLGEPGHIAFACVDSLGEGPGGRGLARAPCEATVDARDGGAQPDFAEDGLALADGAFAAAIAPGAYRVVVTRGPEYGTGTWDAVVAAGATARAPVEGAIPIRRVIDTAGYVAVDLAPHFANDDDARDWVTVRAAMGVEAVIAPSADAVALASIVRSLHAAGRFAVVPGDDLGRDVVSIAGPGDADVLLARVRARTPVTPVATGDPDGPTRTYVGTDDAAPDDLLLGLRARRDVVASEGPFVRATANDATIGGVARVRSGRTVEVRVHVECAPGVDVDRARVLRASGAVVEAKALAFADLPTGARAANATFSFAAPVDDALVVVVDSDADAGGGDSSWAVTGAIWIDANGDGESLGYTAPKIERKPPEATPGKRLDGKDGKDKKRPR